MAYINCTKVRKVGALVRRKSTRRGTLAGDHWDYDCSQRTENLGFQISFFALRKVTKMFFKVH